MIFHGHVVSGMGLGRKIGFPTFNLDARPDVEFGVYAVDVVVGADGASKPFHHALMHYGPKPTVGREDIFCEVYFLKFPHDLDVVEMEVHVLGKLRDVMKFESLESLVEQMKKDEGVARGRFFLGQSVKVE